MTEDYEIDIQQTAKEIDRLFASGFYSHGPEWVKSWYSLSLEWSDEDPAYVIYPRSSIPRLLEKATANREVFQLALFVAGTRLKQGIELHEDLRNFVAGVLLGDVEAPKPPSGRSNKNTWGRDYIVFSVMSDLEFRLGLAMGQNVERKGKRTYQTSTSEIVEAAIARSKMDNLGRHQIGKIWQRASVREEFRQMSELRDHHDLDDMNDIERQ